MLAGMIAACVGMFSSISQVLIIEAGVSQGLPEIDPDLRVGEIELDPRAIEGLLGLRVGGHEQGEFLMPLAGAGDLLLDNVFDFRCYYFHGLWSSIKSLDVETADVELTFAVNDPLRLWVYWNRGSSSLPISSKVSS